MEPKPVHKQARFVTDNDDLDLMMMSMRSFLFLNGEYTVSVLQVKYFLWSKNEKKPN